MAQYFTTARSLLLESITILSYKLPCKLSSGSQFPNRLCCLDRGCHAMLLFMTIVFIFGNDNGSTIITLEFNLERLIIL